MKIGSEILFAVVAGVTTLGAIIGGFLIIGSPTDIRMRRFDEMRAGNLGAISRAVATYTRTHSKLPQKLEDLTTTSQISQYGLRLTDPLGRPYEYLVKGAFSYQLCAVFDTKGEPRAAASRFQSIFSKHARGQQCFNLEARPPGQR